MGPSVDGQPSTSAGAPAGDDGQPATDQPAPPPTAENTSPRALHFEKTFALTVTHVALPASPATQAERFNYDPNCVSFGKDQVWLIFNGTAEATWTSSSQFASKMTIDVRDIAVMATNNGSASPSRVEFGRFQTVPNALLGLLFTVQPTDPGVVAKQAVTLALSFNYLGVADLDTEVIPCVYRTAFDDEHVNRSEGGF